MTDTEYNRLYMRKKRIERRKKGLCVVCGSEPAEEGKVSGTKCLDRVRRKRAEKSRLNGMNYEDSKKLKG